MSLTYLLGIAIALATLVFIVELLRRGILREKYAALWLVVALIVLVIAVFPGLLSWLAVVLGVAVPANLLFFLAGVLLLLVSVQLSFEVSQVEARTRRLAEEVALLQHDVNELRGGRNPSVADDD